METQVFIQWYTVCIRDELLWYMNSWRRYV